MKDDDATYYQEHKDDEEEWGDAVPAPKRSESRRLGAMVSVRFSSEEVDQLRRAADLEGRSLSGYVRNAALNLSSVPTIQAISSTVNLGLFDPLLSQVSYDDEQRSESNHLISPGHVRFGNRSLVEYSGVACRRCLMPGPGYPTHKSYSSVRACSEN